MNLNLKMTVERSKRRSQFLSELKKKIISVLVL